MTIWIRIAALWPVVLFAGCHQKAATNEISTGAQSAEVAPVSVTVASVEARSVQRRAAVVGSLYPFEDFTITPKVEGRVQAVHFDVGDRVKPGAVLLEIDSTDHQLAVDEAERSLEQELAKLGLDQPPTETFDPEEQPSVIRARLLVERARQNFDRVKSLMLKNAASRDQFDQSETDSQVGDATLKQARLEIGATLAAIKHRQAVLAQSRQKLQETRVLAPQFTAGPEFKGREIEYVVSRRLVSVGEMVRAFPSTPVFELLLDDPIKLRTLIPERYLANVVIGQAVEVRTESWPDKIFQARVSRIDPTINSESRSFMVEGLVQNSEHLLKPGAFAKAEAIISENDKALTVPLEALVTFAGVDKVFRVVNGVANEVEVRLGTRGQGWVEVIGELQPQDLVVTSGQSQLANGSKVAVRGPVTSAAVSAR